MAGRIEADGGSRHVRRSNTPGSAVTAAKAGLLLVAAALALDCVALVVDVMAGRRIVSGVPTAEVGLEFGSTLSRLANLAVPAAVLVGGLAFVWWFHGAYTNLAASSGGRATRFAPVWAVIGWVVPLLNVVRPPQIMSDLTRRSGFVAPWWILWAIGAVIQVALRFVTPERQQGWIYWQLIALIGDLLLLMSLCFGLLLVDEARDTGRL